MRIVTALGVVLFLVTAQASTLRGQELRWENRGQPEFTGAALDLDGAGSIVVVAGLVGNDVNTAQWFVRALDRKTGAAIWEDRFGPVTFGFAKDIAIEGAGRSWRDGY